MIVEVWGQAKRRGAPEYQNLVLIRRSEIGKLEDEIELIFCALGLLMRRAGDYLRGETLCSGRIAMQIARG